MPTRVWNYSSRNTFESKFSNDIYDVWNFGLHCVGGERKKTTKNQNKQSTHVCVWKDAGRLSSSYLHGTELKVRACEWMKPKEYTNGSLSAYASNREHIQTRWNMVTTTW